MKRLFFALDISEYDKEHISQWRTSYLTQIYQHCKNIPQENFHITLAFLGLVNDRQQSKLIEKMAKLRQGVALSASLNLTLDHIGLFKKPQVLYIANREIPVPLLALHQQVKNLIIQEQLPVEERRYVPHISLFRKAKNLATNIALPALKIQISSFSLYQSHSDNDGVQYLKIASWPL